MPNTNKEIVEKLNTAFAENNPEVFLDACAEEATWQMVGDKSYKGKEAIKEFMDSMKDMEPPKFTVDNTFANGDFVTSYGEMTMKDENGKDNPYSFCDIYQFRGGKIVDLRSFVIKHKTEGESSGTAAA
jgi:ketosteroid isomerase-like protein